MDTIVFGDGNLGRAIAGALVAAGDSPRVLGRPADGRHAAADVAGARLAFEASRAASVLPNVEVALAGGCRRFVIGTTAWDADRAAVEASLREHGAAAVAAPNLSPGVAVFLRLVESADEALAALGGFEPYLLEWHRRGKADRPSGTAREIARRLAPTRSPGGGAGLEVVSIRAGSSPGMHLVAFDAPGETLELRLTARDRSAYAAGALLAADWLARSERAAGLHSFEEVVDELLCGGVGDPSKRRAVVARRDGPPAVLPAARPGRRGRTQSPGAAR